MFIHKRIHIFDYAINLLFNISNNFNSSQPSNVYLKTALVAIWSLIKTKLALGQVYTA